MRKLFRDTGSQWIEKSKSVSCSVMSDLCNPMGCSLPGSSVHGILQARILEWVAIPFSIPFSRGSSQPWSLAMQADSLLTLLILYIFLFFYDNYYIHSHFSFFISYSSWKMFPVFYFCIYFHIFYFLYFILFLCILWVCP